MTIFDSISPLIGSASSRPQTIYCILCDIVCAVYCRLHVIYYTILYYTILYYAMLYYTTLHYTTLYYTTLHLVAGAAHLYLHPHDRRGLTEPDEELLDIIVTTINIITIMTIIITIIVIIDTCYHYHYYYYHTCYYYHCYY